MNYEYYKSYIFNLYIKYIHTCNNYMYIMSPHQCTYYIYIVTTFTLQ